MRQILLDENKEAEAHGFYMVGAFEVSPDHKRLAYAVDTEGGEKYTLYVKVCCGTWTLCHSARPCKFSLQHICHSGYCRPVLCRSDVPVPRRGTQLKLLVA
jgi:hypothetical protein